MDFESFYRSQYDRVLRTACLLTGNTSDARELTQEAFARALASWPRVEKMEAPGAWLHAVLVNLVRRQGRRRKKERAALERGYDHLRLELRPGDGASDLRLLLADALDDLPARQREAVVLRYLADMSVKDTAVAMRCTTGSVKKHCSRAIEALRDALDVLDDNRARELLYAS